MNYVLIVIFTSWINILPMATFSTNVVLIDTEENCMAAIQAIREGMKDRKADIVGIRSATCNRIKK